jgi:hypothetical protein
MCCSAHRPLRVRAHAGSLRSCIWCQRPLAARSQRAGTHSGPLSSHCPAGQRDAGQAPRDIHPRSPLPSSRVRAALRVPLAAAAHAEKPLPQAKKTRGRVQSRAAQNAEESTETMASQALIAVSPDGRYVAAQVQHLLTVVEQRYGRSAPDNAVADFCGRGRGRDSANRC